MTSETPFYYGRAENKLNSKSQVAIPARFRSVLPEEDQNRNYVIVRGADACLYMYTHRQFGKIKDNARRVAEESGDRAFYRNFMAEACPVEIDTQGRFVLPQIFIKAAGIKGQNVLFIGVDDRIEIWDPETYADQQGRSERFEEKLRDANDKIFGF